jgi:hypothetical protein
MRTTSQYFSTVEKNKFPEENNTKMSDHNPVACAACDPQLVRTPTNCDQLNYLDRELLPGHYCTLSSGSPPRGSTSTLHSRRPIVSYRTKTSDTFGLYMVQQAVHGTQSACVSSRRSVARRAWLLAPANPGRVRRRACSTHTCRKVRGHRHMATLVDNPWETTRGFAKGHAVELAPHQSWYCTPAL